LRVNPDCCTFVKQLEPAMLNAYLRKSGGSLIMTIPASYAEQNGLDAGSCVSVDINGAELRVKPGRKRKTLAELLAATPSDAGRVEGWDEMPAVGAEL
jgi:antitoxin ChpS